MVKRLWLLAFVVFTIGCAEEEVPAGLDARAWFIRASLDTRGVRPSAEELAYVVAHPDEADGLISAMVDDARLGDRVRSIFANAFRTRRDYFEFGGESYGLDEESGAKLERAIAEEAPNLAGYLAVSDRPFSELLTADYTIVDPVLTQIWPLTAVADQPADLPFGTIMARYGDGRPPAGVLAANGIYWRHTSTVENANRGRSNALSRALLCEDYLDRPIDFPKDVDLTDTEAIKHAIQTNPGCRACHATLDPFASHLWGFMQTNDDDPWSWTHYHAENELMWQTETSAVPAYFGSPTAGTLDDLARAIASDERFVACTVKRVYEDLLGRRAEFADQGQLVAHREVFLASGLSLKALVKSIIHGPAYHGIAEVSAWGGEPEPVTMKLASPELYASQLAELTGYVMMVDGRAATEVDYAVRAFAGASERGAATTPSLGHALVHRRLAEAAARSVVDGWAPDARVSRLLPAGASRPTEEMVVGLVQEICSRDADPAEVGALIGLWDSVAASDDAVAAWSALLTVLLADPALALY